jgi:hypothetical protein
MTEPMRHKVGDVDPAGMKTLHDAMAGKATPPVKTAPAHAAKPAPDRSVLGALRDLLNEHVPREPVHNGKTVMQAVDEAVKGADGSNPDY